MEGAHLAGLRLALEGKGFALDLAFDAFGQAPGKFAFWSLDLHRAIG